MCIKILIKLFFLHILKGTQGGGGGYLNTPNTSYEAKYKLWKEYHAFLLSFDFQQHSWLQVWRQYTCYTDVAKKEKEKEENHNGSFRERKRPNKNKILIDSQKLVHLSDM
jgi:hypothetical protein